MKFRVHYNRFNTLTQNMELAESEIEADTCTQTEVGGLLLQRVKEVGPTGYQGPAIRYYDGIFTIPPGMWILCDGADESGLIAKPIAGGKPAIMGPRPQR